MSREDGCRVQPDRLRTSKGAYQTITSGSFNDVEDLCTQLNAVYHPGGHNGVAECMNDPSGRVGPMAYAECSGMVIVVIH